MFSGTAGKDSDLRQVVYEYSTPLSVALQFGNLWSPLLVPDAKELLPLLDNCERLGDISIVGASATVDEAYKWKEAVIDDGRNLFNGCPDHYRPFIVSGNIRPYFHTWGKRPVQYIKHRYHNPVLDITHPAVTARRKKSGAARKADHFWDVETPSMCIRSSWYGGWHFNHIGNGHKS